MDLDAPADATELTPEIVRLAYRLFLGREAESDAVVQAALSYGSIAALRQAFIGGAEFQGLLPPRPSLVPLDAPPLHIEWQVDETNGARLLQHVQRTWTRLGQERPHWSVLSSEDFLPERIAATQAHFFESGQQDVDELVGILARARILPADLPRVFEFGCGVGRVTAHLAKRFAQVTAADVSTSHLKLAREHVAASGARNVGFVLVEDARFGMTGSFDLWFTRLVLQHNPPPVMAMILARALSCLGPRGIAVFQIPTYAIGYEFRLAPYLQGLQATGEVEMHALPQSVVFSLAQKARCEVLEVLTDTSAGNPKTWTSNTFVVRKPA